MYFFNLSFSKFVQCRNRRKYSNYYLVQVKKLDSFFKSSTAKKTMKGDRNFVIIELETKINFRVIL